MPPSLKPPPAFIRTITMPYGDMAPHICTACPAGTRVGYLGTSRKRVSFAEYAEELQFSGSDGSGSPDSITEEDLLEAQGVPSARRGLGGR